MSVVRWTGWLVVCTWIGLCNSAAMGQIHDGCASLNIELGETAKISCPVEPGQIYRWESDRVETLALLSDPSDPEPVVQIPHGLDYVGMLTFYRVRLDTQGKELARDVVMVMVTSGMDQLCEEMDPEFGHGIGRPDCIPRRDRLEIDRVRGSVNRYPAQSFSPGGVEDGISLAGPALQCISDLTVESGEEGVVVCEGRSGSSSMLQYTATFDWPPYHQTTMLEAGSIEYVVKAPSIEDATDQRRLDIVVQDLATGATATQTIQVQVVNSSPVFECQDMELEERQRGALSCSEVPGMRYQVLPQAGGEDLPRGVFDDMPIIEAPSVDGDQQFSVLVRAIDEHSRRMVQRTMMLTVRDRTAPIAATQPFDPQILQLECDPVRVEVFEGGPPVEISCSVTSGTVEDNSWVWSCIRPDRTEACSRVTFHASPSIVTFTPPANVNLEANEPGVEYLYSVAVSGVNEETGEQENAKEEIIIIVKEKPDIVVECPPLRARAGDPPLPVGCSAQNELGVEREYEWDWWAINTADQARIHSESASGDDWSALFDVPVFQPVRERVYEYAVVVSAADADAPADPARLLITTEAVFGTLTLACIDPPFVYEGSGNFELDCLAEGADDESVIEWSWTPVSGTEDRLVQNPDGNSAPIFTVPETVTSAVEYYEYLLVAGADYYNSSEPALVRIEVRERPRLALQCENSVRVNVSAPPRRLFCEVSASDPDFVIEASWQWTPDEMLTEADTPTPLFVVPVEQREASIDYPLVVEVSAPQAIPTSEEVVVTVINPGAGQAFQLAVSTSPIDLGTLTEADGVGGVDPATERAFGSVVAGAGQAGRMLIVAQDSLTFELEVIEDAILKHSEVADANNLTLKTRWSYSTTCERQAPENWTSRRVPASLGPSECHMVRIGGDVNLEGAVPGHYEGAATVLLTNGITEEAYSVPVVLDVDLLPRVLSLGTGGGRFADTVMPESGLEYDQTVRVFPLLVALGDRRMDGVLEIANPSVVALEVSIESAFGYLESADQPGNMAQVMVLEPMDAPVGDLSSRLLVDPPVFTLLPGQKRVVRYALNESSRGRLEDRGYAAFLNVTSAPRQFANANYTPSDAPPLRTARVTTSIPAIYVPGGPAGFANVRLEAANTGQDPAVTIVVEAGDRPFAGDLEVRDDRGELLGSAPLIVYTRSRVRVPLVRSPGPRVTIHFKSGTAGTRPAPIILDTAP